MLTYMPTIHRGDIDSGVRRILIKIVQILLINGTKYNKHCIVYLNQHTDYRSGFMLLSITDTNDNGIRRLIYVYTQNALPIGDTYSNTCQLALVW